MNKWSVHVTDFGKIESADIQIAPLTFFLGDNNSGKSYMMTLIYGLLKTEFYFERYDFCIDTEAYKECCNILDNCLKKQEQYKDTEKSYILKNNEMKSFEKLLNHILEKGKKNFLKKLFNKDMNIGELSVAFSIENEYEFQIQQIYFGKENEREVKICAGKGISNYCIDGILQEGKYEFFISYILQYMLKKDLCENHVKNEIIYFPTARTGFMLTYKALIGNAIREIFTERESVKKLLTKPNVDFLYNLSKISSQYIEEQYQDVVNFMEQNLIFGKMITSDSPTSDVLYKPQNSSEALPLHITSGVVTELAPLLLMLKHIPIDTILIEEPEISLHPKLQLEMARTLIRIVNKGTSVFVTTHCDIIIQHINNMIKANELKNKEDFLKQYNYTKEDLLQRDIVELYQFDVQENEKTKVTRIPCGDYGFEAITFYNTLKNINDQIDEIENLKNAEEMEA